MSLEFVSRHCPAELKIFSVKECDVTDAGIATVVEKCRQLYILNYEGCSRVNGDWAEAITGECDQMEQFYAICC